MVLFQWTVCVLQCVMRKQETHNFGRFGYRMTQCARTLNYIGFLLFYSFYVYLVSFRLYVFFFVVKLILVLCLMISVLTRFVKQSARIQCIIFVLNSVCSSTVSPRCWSFLFPINWHKQQSIVLVFFSFFSLSFCFLLHRRRRLLKFYIYVCIFT